MIQLLSVQGDKIVIKNLELENLSGAVTHTGSFTITEELVVDTIRVRNLITEDAPLVDLSNVGQWAFNTEAELAGKGFSWTYGTGSTQLFYRDGGRLWTNGDIDLEASRSYRIDNVAVLSANTLGATIIKSNLREVGKLNSLIVVGEASIGEFAFFTGFNRLGLGTDEPNASISIVENDVEIAIGSPAYGTANIGTYSNHDLDIITDNTARMSIKNNGEVHIGNESGKSGVLRVFGEIYADAVISDTRVERTSPLEFKATRDASIYGKGLLWSGTGVTRQLIMMAGPDRLWSSESIEVAENQCFYINGKAALTATALGQTITDSRLTTVGNLLALTVQGTTTLLGDLDASVGVSKFKSVVLTDFDANTTITATGINANKNISVKIQESEVFYADGNEIAVGNKTNTRRPVKVFGPMSIGINNPDPTVGLSVSGDVSFANKKFITGTSIPTSGSYVKGDICWNQDPREGSYIGWVCVVDGTPGIWLSFGAIGRQ